MKKIVCIACKGELEEGAIGNNNMNWRTGKVPGRKFSEVITFGTESVYSFRCTNCGLIQQYTRFHVEKNE